MFERSKILRTVLEAVSPVEIRAIKRIARINIIIRGSAAHGACPQFFVVLTFFPRFRSESVSTRFHAGPRWTRMPSLSTLPRSSGRNNYDDNRFILGLWPPCSAYLSTLLLSSLACPVVRRRRCSGSWTVFAEEFRFRSRGRR